jgi:hypothetical protein
MRDMLVCGGGEKYLDFNAGVDIKVDAASLMDNQRILIFVFMYIGYLGDKSLIDTLNEETTKCI